MRSRSGGGAESTCRGRTERRRRAPTVTHVARGPPAGDWAGLKPVPGPASGLASAPCGQSLLTKKRNGRKGRNFSLDAVRADRSSFTRTHFTLIVLCDMYTQEVNVSEDCLVSI